MKLKKSEKWILAITLSVMLLALGLTAVRGGEETVFRFEQNRVLSRGDAEQNGDRININTATAEQLQELEGIGPALAEKIVAYREANGDFKRIEDIAFVSGIGSEKFDGIRDEITVD